MNYPKIKYVRQGIIEDKILNAFRNCQIEKEDEVIAVVIKSIKFSNSPNETGEYVNLLELKSGNSLVIDIRYMKEILKQTTLYMSKTVDLDKMVIGMIYDWHRMEYLFVSVPYLA